MNLPNRLTVARLFLTLAFVAALSIDWPFSKTTALVLFIIASVTDWVDGEIARRFNLVTDFGKLMDPLVDKIMMAAAFICLVPLGMIPAWAAVIIISREFLITGLRMLALNKGQVLPAEGMGKHKTIWQIVTVLFFLLCLAVREVGELTPFIVPAWLTLMGAHGGAALLALALILTLYSGFNYLWNNRALIRAG